MMAGPIIIRDTAGRQIVQRHIAGLNLDKPWSITIKPHRKIRSLSQNALLWKWYETVVAELHDTTGQDKEAIHDAFKQKFLKPKVTDALGEVVTTYSTKGLETPEMSTFMDEIYAYCTTEWGLLLPLPGDLGRAA